MGIKSILLTILGIGLTGGIATGGYFFVQPQNIKDLVMQEGSKPLDTSSDTNNEKWEELIKLHKKATESIQFKNNISIKLLIGEEDLSVKATEGMKKLKQECKKLFQKKITDTKEKDRIDAKNWCTLNSPLLDKNNFPEANKPLASAGALPSG